LPPSLDVITTVHRFLLPKLGNIKEEKMKREKAEAAKALQVKKLLSGAWRVFPSMVSSRISHPKC